MNLEFWTLHLNWFKGLMPVVAMPFLPYLAIIFIPFLGFLGAFSLNVLETTFNKRINPIFGGFFTIFGIFTSFLLSLKLLLTHLGSEINYVNFSVADWISLGVSRSVEYKSFLLISWGFLFDAITLVMCVVITSVSLLVHIYSMEYMAHDPARNRFLSYLSLFVFFMLVLVTANNYAQAFIGWEGVGLVSYLLISFWFMRTEAARSALKAVSVNKIGDFGYVMMMLFMLFNFQSLDFHTVFALAEQSVGVSTSFIFDVAPLTVISGFLLVAAVGKSAQLGLHTWLPDAMEGPTPVSALIHAATMVTAGVYLLVRTSPVLELAPNVLSLVIFLGASTALFGASTALFQNDIKKIIAYSTCSQLGYMFLACGLSAYGAAMFHLFTHAFFKALLFLGAGSVIHALSDEQDIRRMGGLARILPFTFAIFTVGSFSLMGLPFLSGYYSKDLILELAYSSTSILGAYAYGAGLVAAIFTAAYSARLSYLAFLTDTNAHRRSVEHAHEPAPAMFYPLVFLVVLSVVSGAIFYPIFMDNGFWAQAIFIDLANVANQGDVHALESGIKLLPTCCVLLSFGSFLMLYHYFNFEVSLLAFYNTPSRLVHAFFNKKWYFDHFYGAHIIRRGYLLLYKWIFKVFERGLLTGTLVGLSINSLLFGANYLRRLHTGYIYHYGLAVVFTLVISFLLVVYV